jgi:hypothetical protein
LTYLEIRDNIVYIEIRTEASMGKIIQFRLDRHNEAKLKSGFYDSPGFQERAVTTPTPPTGFEAALQRPGFILVAYQTDNFGSGQWIRVYWVPESGRYVFHGDSGEIGAITSMMPKQVKESALSIALKLLKENCIANKAVLISPELLNSKPDRRPDYVAKTKMEEKSHG